MSVRLVEGFHWIGLCQPKIDDDDFFWLDELGDIVDHNDEINLYGCAGLGITIATSRVCESQEGFICQRGK